VEIIVTALTLTGGLLFGLSVALAAWGVYLTRMMGHRMAQIAKLEADLAAAVSDTLLTRKSFSDEISAIRDKVTGLSYTAGKK
jgi:hypothetical protein